MSSRTHLVAVSAVLTIALGIGVTIAPANAQIPPMPGVNLISGTYTNEEAGVEIVFPEGWEGVELSAEGSVIASAYAGGMEAASAGDIATAMIVIVSDKGEADAPPTEPPIMSEDDQVDCNIVSTGNVQVAGVTGVEIIQECTMNGQAVKMKVASVETGARWVVAMYMAPSAEYDQNVAAYDNSVATLQVEGAIDAEDGGILDGIEIDLQAAIQTVVIAGEDVNVDVRSSSTISEFQLDEENKRLSFKVDGETGTDGATEISIGTVLEGPYTVTIDGQATTDFEVTNTPSGEAMIMISYTHSVHDVTVTGTSVVPEFPAHVIGAIAAIIGVVAFLSRSKLMNGLKSMH